jgi:hypothetical protein
VAEVFALTINTLCWCLFIFLLSWLIFCKFIKKFCVYFHFILHKRTGKLLSCNSVRFSLNYKVWHKVLSLFPQSHKQWANDKNNLAKKWLFIRHELMYNTQISLFR